MSGYEAGVEFYERRLEKLKDKYTHSKGNYETITNLDEIEIAYLKLNQLHRRKRWGG